MTKAQIKALPIEKQLTLLRNVLAVCDVVVTGAYGSHAHAISNSVRLSDKSDKYYDGVKPGETLIIVTDLMSG